MLYTLGDTHLSLLVDKKMDVFGGAWEGYTDKLREGFSCLGEEDTIVLCGDISWGMNLREALPDFMFLNEFPGKKLIIKGNHDYWWETAAKIKAFMESNGLMNFDILHNNAFVFGDKALCGTRGWIFEDESGDKIMKREAGRLKTSLELGKKLMPEGELLVFFHYPPLYEGFRCDEFIEIMNDYGVRRCYYGHLHGHSRARAVEGNVGGIEYKLVSADHINFKPAVIF